MSYILILAGALTTFASAEKGRIHLRIGEDIEMMINEQDQTQCLPFRLRLESFSISTYSGSKAEADYISTVRILPGENVHTISMNHILKYKGYRFYQDDYDEDKMGVTLSVNHDPWGIGITYSGYLMLLVSIIFFFFQRGTAFRAALKRLSLTLVLIFGFCGNHELNAGQLPGNMPKVLPEQVAESFSDLYVYYNDRICPLSTLDMDYCLKAYGKSSWNGYSADQVVSGWLFYYDWWHVVPFKVKEKDRGSTVETEKEFLLKSVASGDAFKIFPIADADGTICWYSCNDALPPNVMDNYEQWVFVRKSLDLIEESVRKEDWNEVVRLVGKIKVYQGKTASGYIPSAATVKAERVYNHICRPRVPFMIAITLGIILFIFSGFLLAKGKNLPGGLQCQTLGLLIILLFYLTSVLGLRWYVSGQAPFAGSYCVMMLMAWLSCLCSIVLYRRFPLILPVGLLIAGFTMLVASIAGSNPQITHIMPVLQSPLLSIHVLSMMISYTLFSLVALCGFLGVLMPDKDAAFRLRDISLVVLYPGIFLLAFGIFLGAVWANISWGSYWSWDPKETWAIITLLVYSFALHSGSLKCFRNPRFFHIYSILAFLSVLITYFGVNLLLGGMHAYS
ncbi:MAG: cytochrome c biogenesis protein CcsA, partial [Candidatus Cryptobacteroides sp.]